MKKTIITLATLALLTTGSVMAQRGYNGTYNQYPSPAPSYPGNQYPNNAYPNNQYPNNAYPNNQYQTNPHIDDAQDWYRIERLDEIVNLSHPQKRQLKRIEDQYDRLGLTPGGRLNPQDAQRLQWQKKQEVMGVLNPIQRDRLYAFEQSRRGYRGGESYGRRY